MRQLVRADRVQIMQQRMDFGFLGGACIRSGDIFWARYIKLKVPVVSGRCSLRYLAARKNDIGVLGSAHCPICDEGTIICLRLDMLEVEFYRRTKCGQGSPPRTYDFGDLGNASIRKGVLLGRFTSS